jgi:hypothetical protein
VFQAVGQSVVIRIAVEALHSRCISRLQFIARFPVVRQSIAIPIEQQAGNLWSRLPSSGR